MDKKNLLKQKNCPKIIRFNKYGKENQEAEQWWWNQLANFEQEFYVSFQKRLKYLNRCFSKEYLKDLMKMGIDLFAVDKFQDIYSDSSSKSSERNLSGKAFVRMEKSVWKSKYTNPYLEFMKKSPEKVQIWRTKIADSQKSFVIKENNIENLKLLKMDIVRKAKILEELIVTGFCDWCTKESELKSKIDNETVSEIFQLLYTGAIAASITRSLFEIDAITETTANFMNAAECTKEAQITKLLKNDLKNFNCHPVTVAFGKCLPARLRQVLLETELYKNWFDIVDIENHKELDSMAAVWKGITQLESTRLFCKWLLEHPEINPPKFLEKEGLLDEEVLEKLKTEVIDLNLNDSMNLILKEMATFNISKEAIANLV